MSFATHVQRQNGDIGLQFYAYVAGIPYIFGSHDKPAHWTLPSGYTWSRSLVLTRPDGTSTQLRTVGADVDPQMGLLASGMTSLEFYYDPITLEGAWPALISPDTRTTVPLDPTYLVRPRDDRFHLSDFANFSQTTWYAGLETIEFSGTYSAAGGYADANRGLFESPRQWYGPRGARAVSIGGVIELTSWPDSWKGRQLRVWAAASQMHRGVLTALSSEPRGTECLEIFRGEVTDLVVGEDRCSVTLEAASLSQCLARPALSRGRKYQAGPKPGGLGWVSVEEDGPRYIEVSHTTSVSDWGSQRFKLDVWPLLGSEDREVQATTLLSEIAYEIRNHYVDGSNFLTVAIELEDADEDGSQRVKISWTHYDSAIADYGQFGTFWVHGDAPRSLWPALGVTGEWALIGSGTLRSGVSWVEWSCPDNIPYYYVGPTNKWLYYRGTIDEDFISGIRPKTDDPPDLQRTERLTGRIDGVYVKLGDQTIAELRMRDVDGRMIPGHDSGVFRAEILRLGACGSDAISSWTIPSDEASGEGTEMVVGIGFDGHALFDAIRAMMVSNGDADVPAVAFNVLPEGFGASINPDYIDNDSWDAVQRETGAEATGWWISESTPIRELLGAVTRAYGILLYERQTADGIKLSMVRALVPPASSDSVADIDDLWTWSADDAPEVRRSEDRIINVISIQYSWDPIEEKWRSRSTEYVDAQSVARYGESTPMAIELPWALGYSDARIATDPVAYGLLSMWGRPQVTYEVPLYNAAALALEPMQVVKATLPFVPDWVDGGFGVASRYARVVRVTKSYGPDDDGQPFATATLWPQPDRQRYAPYYPSLRLLANVSGAVYTFRRDVNDGGFSEPGADRDDADWWTDSADDTWIVRAYVPWADNESLNQARTVSAIDITAEPPTITLSSALTADLATYVADVVLSSRDFSTSGHALSQEPFVYLAAAPDLSGSGNTYKLTRSDATTIDGVRWR